MEIKKGELKRKILQTLIIKNIEFETNVKYKDRHEKKKLNTWLPLRIRKVRRSTKFKLITRKRWIIYKIIPFIESIREFLGKQLEWYWRKDKRHQGDRTQHRLARCGTGEEETQDRANRLCLKLKLEQEHWGKFFSKPAPS